jgi:hypothetical protein
MVAFNKMAETLVVIDVQCPHAKVSEEAKRVQSVGG